MTFKKSFSVILGIIAFEKLPPIKFQYFSLAHFWKLDIKVKSSGCNIIEPFHIVIAQSKRDELNLR